MRISDWSSDVCSSDLQWGRERQYDAGKQAPAGEPQHLRGQWNAHVDQHARDVWADRARQHHPGHGDRKSVVSGKRVLVCVDMGGRRIIKKNKHIIHITTPLKLILSIIKNLSYQ